MILSLVLVTAAAASAHGPASTGFTLNSSCPPSFEKTGAGVCELRTLYQFYDSLEGRGLGSKGYEGALQYVEKTLTADGLAPAGENGGFRQRVPLRNAVVDQKASSVTITSKAGKRTLVYGKDYLLSADQLRTDVTLDDAPIVFVGYGVSAPAQRVGGAIDQRQHATSRLGIRTP